MAWSDRPYAQEEPPTGRFGPRLGMRSVVTWLIIINAALFVWDGIFGGSRRGSGLTLWPHMYFSVDTAIYGWQVWRFVTYQFFHADFFHILFNMIGLFFFGPLIERWWGKRRFIAFYLLCGVGGAIVATLLGAIPGLDILPPGVMVVGASGSIFGILAACAVLFPKQRVMLIFPPIPMTMRTMALIFLGIAALSLIAGSTNAGGEAAHLGGALIGWVFAVRPAWLNWADRVSPTAIQAGAREGRWKRKLEQQRREDQEVDRILAKVREHGLAGLTRREKKALQRATERHRRDAG